MIEKFSLDVELCSYCEIKNSILCLLPYPTEHTICVYASLSFCVNRSRRKTFSLRFSFGCFFAAAVAKNDMLETYFQCVSSLISGIKERSLHSILLCILASHRWTTWKEGKRDQTRNWNVCINSTRIDNRLKLIAKDIKWVKQRKHIQVPLKSKKKH